MRQQRPLPCSGGRRASSSTPGRNHDDDDGSSGVTNDEGRKWRPRGQTPGWRQPVPSPSLTHIPRGYGGTRGEAQSLAQTLVSMQPVTPPPPFEEVYGLVRTTHYARTLKMWGQCHAARLRGDWGLQVHLILDSGGADGWGRVRAHSQELRHLAQWHRPRVG